MGPRGLRWTFSLVALVILAGYFYSNWSNRYNFHEHARQLREKLTPPGGTATQVEFHQESDFAIVARWQVATDWEWHEYADWIEKQEFTHLSKSEDQRDRLEYRFEIGFDKVTLRIRKGNPTQFVLRAVAG